MECFAQFGPLCWTTEGKFWLFIIGLTITWSIVGVVLFFNHRRNKAFQKEIAELRNRVRGENG